MPFRPSLILAALSSALPLTAQYAPRALPADEVPSDNGAALFELANLAYSQKDYDLAEKNYGAYLRNFPGGSHADEAQFQTAQCALRRNDAKTAREALEALMASGRSGLPASGGAFLLAVMEYKDKDWANATKHFKIARAGLTDPQRRLEATYFLARSLQNAEKRDEAATYFESVSQSGADSPYVVDATRQVANARLAAGNDSGALQAFSSLLKVTQDPEEKAEYLVKSGLIQLDKGQVTAATESFNAALTLPDAPRNWRSYALASLLQTQWRANAWDNVISLADSQADLLKEEPRYESSLIVGDAHRMTKQYGPAAVDYQKAEELAPEPAQAMEAGYFRLLCLYQALDDSLPQVARHFADKFTKAFPDSPQPPKALRLAGDYLYTKKNFGEASKVYGSIDLSKLPEDLRAGVLLRLGWSQWESGARDASEATFTLFLEAYPRHPEAVAALTRRGLARMERKDYEGALSDMLAVTSRYPDSPYAQQALHATAVIYGQLKRWQNLILAYDSLHKKHPETKATGEGYYWIGRAYMELQKPDQAVPFLKAAMQANPKTYGKDAGLLALYSFYSRKAYASLSTEIQQMAAQYPDVTIPPRMCWWTGQQWFAIKDYPNAAKLLQLGNANAVKAREPVPLPVWDMLETALFTQGNFEGALAAADKMLAAPESQPKEKGALKANLLRRKALCLIGLKKYEEARAATKEGLEIIKEGEINARLMLTMGDVDLARGRALVAENRADEAIPLIQEAVKSYIVVSQTVSNAEITPEALYKAAASLRFLKENDRAAVLQAQLKRDYPDYKTP